MNESGIIIPWFTHLLMKINSRHEDETVAVILVASSCLWQKKNLAFALYHLLVKLNLKNFAHGISPAVCHLHFS